MNENDNICFICEKPCKELLELSSDHNQIFRQNLESYLEEKLINEYVCFPCRNNFESLYHPLALFKNQFIFIKKGTGMNEKDMNITCSLCGQLSSLNTGQFTKIASHPDIVDILHTRLKEEPVPNDKSICHKCLRYLKKIYWLHSELISLESHIETSLQKERNRKDVQFLITKSTEPDINPSDIFFLIKELDFKGELNQTVPFAIFQKGVILSRIIIDRISMNNDIQAKNYIICVNDENYISYQSLKNLKPKLEIDESKIHVTVSVENHQVEANLMRCGKCDYSSNSLNLLIIHIESNHQAKKVVSKLPTEISSLVLYRCSFCKEEFDRKSEFRSHNVVCKSGLPTATSVECQVCNKLFRTKESLSVHLLRDHEGSKTPWTCNLCKKGFTRKASYEEHINRHKGIKERKCEICNKFYYETAYWRHMKTVHASADTFLYSCDVCNKQFSHRFKLKQHSLVHVSTTERNFNCQHSNCDKMFVNQEKLKNHVKSVHQNKFSSPLVCAECGATYSKFSSICSHQRNCHSLESLRPLSCPHCPQTFSVSAALNKHITLKHTHNRLFSCSYENCDEIFKSTADQLEHEQNIHTIQTFQLINDDTENIDDDGFSDSIVLIEMDGEETNVTTLKHDLCVADQQQDNIREERGSDMNLIRSNELELKLCFLNNDNSMSENNQTVSNDASETEILNQDSLLVENNSVLQNSTSQPVQLQQQEISDQKNNSNQILSVKSEEQFNHQMFAQVNYQLDSQHDLKLPARLLQNPSFTTLQDPEISEINNIVLPDETQFITNMKQQKPRQLKFKDDSLFKSPLDFNSSIKLRTNNIQKPKMFESLLLQNINRFKKSTKSVTLLAPSLTDNDNIPVHFPPLPSSPPDTMLDVPIADHHDMDEINQAIKQKMMSQSEFDFVLDNSSITSQEYPLEREDDKNIVIDIDNGSLYKCTDCSVIIADPQALNSHVCKELAILANKKVNVLSKSKKESEPKERPFECELCKKKFTTKKVLKRHTRVHTGDRPYTCEFCSKTFAAASNLSEHRTLHTGRMAYSCTVCGNKFRLWSILKKHKLKCQQD